MERINALKALLAKVEAGGKASHIDFFTALDALTADGDGGLTARNAYHGSLDAAMALHEAVLPGWLWARSVSGAMVVFPETDDFFEAARNQFASAHTNTARAWLIAILKTLIAEAEA